MVFYMLKHIKCTNHIICSIFERQGNTINFRNISMAEFFHEIYGVIRCINIVDFAEFFKHVDRTTRAATNIQYSRVGPVSGSTLHVSLYNL